jgi:DNA-binding response OmpR family regulator
LVPTSSKYRGVVRFDGFELDLASGHLRRDGISLRLQPQPTKVLVELVGRAGEVVSRKELADQVWGSETFVDFEQGLNFAIRQIRTPSETTPISLVSSRSFPSVDTVSSAQWKKRRPKANLFQRSLLPVRSGGR